MNIGYVALKVLKSILLSMLSEAFLKWLFFWAGQMLVDSTKTTKDDEFLAKVKEVYDSSEKEV